MTDTEDRRRVEERLAKELWPQRDTRFVLEIYAAWPNTADARIWEALVTREVKLEKLRVSIRHSLAMNVHDERVAFLEDLLR